MNIAVLGSGYVGLVSGLCLSQAGHNIRCIDINKAVVQAINKGKPKFYEKGLEDLLKSELKSNRFFALRKLDDLDIEIDIIIIAVGTPSNNNGDIDLSFIKNASKNIAHYIKEVKNHVSIVVKSTVLPGTTDTLIKNILEKESSKKLGEFGLGMNPEFLREGNAIYDFLNADRIIIGWEDEKTKIRLENLYKPWTCEKITVNTRTAEFIKYTNNCFLALQVSTTNEIANLAYEVGGVDIQEIMSGLYLDHRWNPKVEGKRINPKILTYLKAGCGFGGSCFPKDLKALRNFGKRKGIEMQILESILEVNNTQWLKLIKIIKKIKNLKKLNLLILGLSFKEDTDDVRESPAIKIIPELRKSVNKIYAHDPRGIENFKDIIDSSEALEYTKSWEKKLKICEVIVILTNWNEYKKLEQIDLRKKILIDPRRFIDRNLISTKQYFSIGLNI